MTSTLMEGEIKPPAPSPVTLHSNIAVSGVFDGNGPTISV